MKTSLQTFLVAAAVAVTAGCGQMPTKKDSGTGCTTSNECTGGQLCIAGVCTAASGGGSGGTGGGTAGTGGTGGGTAGTGGTGGGTAGTGGTGGGTAGTGGTGGGTAGTGGTGGGTAGTGGTGGGTAGTGGTGGTGGASSGSFAALRVGPAADGGALSNAGAPAQVEFLSATGSPTSAAILPVAASSSNNAFSLSGTATSEGVLSTSANGAYVVVGGYADSPGRASVVAAVGVARVVARVQTSNGTVDTSTLINDAYGSNNLRAAASNDGTGYWVAGPLGTDGGAGAFRYVVHGSTGASTFVCGSPSNVRAVGVYGGQLYGSTAANPPADAGISSRVFGIGTGLPMAAAAPTSLPGVDVTVAQSFTMLDLQSSVPGPDALYVTDQDGGVRKYTSSGTTWTQVGTLPTGLFSLGLNTDGGNVGIQCNNSSAGKLSNGDVMVVCSTSESSGNRIVKWIDTAGSSTTEAPGVTIVNAPAGTVYRGVTMLP